MYKSEEEFSFSKDDLFYLNLAQESTSYVYLPYKYHFC